MKTIATCLLLILAVAPAVAQLDDDFHGRQNTALNFYGKVVDQAGQPLADAKINVERVFGEWTTPPYVQTKSERFAVVTDKLGRFFITNLTGRSLQILSVEKHGYELSTKSTRFFGYTASAEPYHPDSNNPVAFKMWKTMGGEQLVQPRPWNGQVKCDGTTNRFDLSHGTLSVSGDLEIICNRDPLVLPPASNAPYDYKLQITVIGGGLQVTDDEFTYLAPEAGYSKTIIFGQKAGDSNWVGKVKQEFYIKTAGGHFGRLSVDWYAWQQSLTHLDWNCSINPSGSRNLER